MENQIFEVQKEAQINKSITLEPGDRIQVLKEDYAGDYSKGFSELTKFKNPLNVWFELKNRTLRFGSERDKATMFLINVEKDSIVFKTRDSKTLSLGFIAGNLTVYDTQNFGFKIETKDMVLYAVE